MVATSLDFISWESMFPLQSQPFSWLTPALRVTSFGIELSMIFFLNAMKVFYSN